MADIIDQAFRDRMPKHWHELSSWLRSHGKKVKNVEDRIQFSREAQEEGLIFPDSPEEVRLILKKYDPREWAKP